MKDKSAFTLIEMIIVLAIIGGLLVFVSMHVVNLTAIWLNETREEAFEPHVDGVTQFLNNAFAQSESVDGGEASEPFQPVEWARPPSFDEFDDPLLYFRQKTAPALFVRKGGNLPKIHAYFHWEDQLGLSILWYSELDDLDFEFSDELRRTPISPYVTKIEYAYYDREEEDWTIEDEPLEEENETFILPNYVQLTFERNGEELVRTLYIPQRSEDLPLF